MNDDAKVLTHAAFDRPPVTNARRRGPTPRDVPMLNRERRHRELKAQQEARRAPTSDEMLAEYKATINEVARNLLFAARSINALDQKLQGLLGRAT